jgi:hypothetical protein
VVCLNDFVREKFCFGTQCTNEFNAFRIIMVFTISIYSFIGKIIDFPTYFFFIYINIWAESFRFNIHNIGNEEQFFTSCLIIIEVSSSLWKSIWTSFFFEIIFRKANEYRWQSVNWCAKTWTNFHFMLKRVVINIEFSQLEILKYLGTSEKLSVCFGHKI